MHYPTLLHDYFDETVRKFPEKEALICGNKRYTYTDIYNRANILADKLIDMGARIILCDPHRATVIGLNQETPLRGSVMTSPDIRAGVALLIAALSAKGKSIIHNIEQIDRGYENIDERLGRLGAKIKRI